MKKYLVLRECKYGPEHSLTWCDTQKEVDEAVKSEFDFGVTDRPVFLLEVKSLYEITERKMS